MPLTGMFTYRTAQGTVLAIGATLSAGKQALSAAFVPSHLQLIDWLELIALAAIIILAILLGLSRDWRQGRSGAARWGMPVIVILLALALVLYALFFKRASATARLTSGYAASRASASNSPPSTIKRLAISIIRSFFAGAVFKTRTTRSMSFSRLILHLFIAPPAIPAPSAAEHPETAGGTPAFLLACGAGIVSAHPLSPTRRVKV